MSECVRVCVSVYFENLGDHQEKHTNRYSLNGRKPDVFLSSFLFLSLFLMIIMITITTTYCTSEITN